MMAPPLILKQFFRALSPSIFWGFSLVSFFLLSAEARPLSLAEEHIPVLESLRARNVLAAARPIRTSVQFSLRVLYSHSTIDEDFDGDDEEIPSACLKVCYLLVPTDFCEILVPEIKVGHVQRGIVLFLFERPPPSLVPESPTA
jgi:hypothetical protein